MLDTQIPNSLFRGQEKRNKLVQQFGTEQKKFNKGVDTNYKNLLEQRLPTTQRFSFGPKLNDHGLSDMISAKKFSFAKVDNNITLDEQLPENRPFKFSSGIKGLNDHFDSFAPKKDYSYVDPQFYEYKLKGMTIDKLVESKWKQQGTEQPTEQLDPTARAAKFAEEYRKMKHTSDQKEFFDSERNDLKTINKGFERLGAKVKADKTREELNIGKPILGRMIGTVNTDVETSRGTEAIKIGKAIMKTTAHKAENEKRYQQEDNDRENIFKFIAKKDIENYGKQAHKDKEVRVQQKYQLNEDFKAQKKNKTRTDHEYTEQVSNYIKHKENDKRLASVFKFLKANYENLSDEDKAIIIEKLEKRNLNPIEEYVEGTEESKGGEAPVLLTGYNTRSHSRAPSAPFSKVATTVNSTVNSTATSTNSSRRGGEMLSPSSSQLNKAIKDLAEKQDTASKKINNSARKVLAKKLLEGKKLLLEEDSKASNPTVDREKRLQYLSKASEEAQIAVQAQKDLSVLMQSKEKQITAYENVLSSLSKMGAKDKITAKSGMFKELRPLFALHNKAIGGHYTVAGLQTRLMSWKDDVEAEKTNVGQYKEKKASEAVLAKKASQKEASLYKDPKTQKSSNILSLSDIDVDFDLDEIPEEKEKKKRVTKRVVAPPSFGGGAGSAKTNKR